MLQSITYRSSITQQDFKTLVLSSLGGMLETYDFMVFALYAPILSIVFFPASLDLFWSTLHVYGIFAAGYLARPFGGIVIAHFGDRYGRKKIFFFSIALMALPTFSIGLMPTFQTIGFAAPILLVGLRFLQGIAMGGEYPGAFVFVYEHLKTSYRGLWIGVLTASMAFGILLGNFISLGLHFFLTQEEISQFGWRIPFLIGGVFGVITIYLRRYLKETPIFQELQKRKQTHPFPIKKIFQQQKSAFSLSVLLTWISSVFTVTFILLLPNFMQASFGITPNTVTQLQIAVILVGTFGMVSAGFLSDLFGASLVLRIFSIGSMISSFIALGKFYGITLFSVELVSKVGFSELVPFYLLATFFMGISTFVHLLILKSFPPNVRLSGFSTSYNLSYAILGSLTIYLIPLLHGKFPYLLIAYVLFIGLLGLSISYFIAYKKPAY